MEASGYKELNRGDGISVAMSLAGLMNLISTLLCKRGNFSVAYLSNSSYNVGKETAYSTIWSASIIFLLPICRGSSETEKRNISD